MPEVVDFVYSILLAWAAACHLDVAARTSQQRRACLEVERSPMACSDDFATCCEQCFLEVLLRLCFIADPADPPHWLAMFFPTPSSRKRAFLMHINGYIYALEHVHLQEAHDHDRGLC